MELSYFLAQLFGLTLVIISIGALARPEIIFEAVRDLRPFTFCTLMAGFIGIVGGLAIVLSHNIWEVSWRGLVTLFGWSALIKGFTYMVFPEAVVATGRVMLAGRRRTLLLVIVLAVGLYLTYYGFGW